MLFRFKNILIFFLILLVLTYLFTGSTRPGKIVRLAGSTAFQPFAEKLAEIYMEKNPDETIDVQGGGSAVGIMAATTGIADIGMADMVTLPKIVEPLEKIIVAYDGIAVIVNNSKKINNLTRSQLKGIFNGSIKNWRDIGGEDGPIRVISREEGSGTRKSFDQLVLSGGRLTKDAMYQDSNGTIREAVKSDPNAISYISIGFLNSSVRQLTLDGIDATNENVKSGEYTIVRPIYFLIKTNPNKNTKDFISFILSDEAQKIISQDGLISVR